MKTSELLLEADRLIAEVEALRPMDAVKEAAAISKVKLEWTYHSNAMEGNSLTYGETRALVLHEITAKGKPLKDHLDIKGHNRVIDELNDFVRGGDELTEAALRHLHQILLVESYEEKDVTSAGIKTIRKIDIGQYKRTPNHVITSSGDTYIFASPEETPLKVAELIKWYRTERESRAFHPIIFATMFHHKFVAIHPFDDGNGRMARILMNLVLMQYGYFPAVLKLNRKNEYLLALEKANAGELDELVGFVAEAVIESAVIFLRAAKGEAIDELMDYDKELSLWSQTLETAHANFNENRTEASQANVISNFVSPLLTLIYPRLSNIDQHFALKTFHITLKYGKIKMIGESNIVEMLQNLVAQASDIKLAELQIFYHATGYLYDAAKDFLINIQVFFSDRGFSVRIQMTGLQSKQIYSAGYNEHIDEQVIEDLAKNIMQHLVESFKRATQIT